MNFSKAPHKLPQKRLQLTVGLIVLSTALFVVGIVLERQSEANTIGGSYTETSIAQAANESGAESKPTAVSGESSETHSEDSEGKTAIVSGGNGETHIETAESLGGVGESPHTETVLGINIENPAFIASAVVGWVVLGIVLMRFGYPTLIVIAIAAGAMAVFDIVEVVTQFNRANTGIAIVALLVALIHITLAAVSIITWNTSRSLDHVSSASVS